MVHYNFGLALVCAGDYDRAAQEVQRALELDAANGTVEGEVERTPQAQPLHQLTIRRPGATVGSERSAFRQQLRFYLDFGVLAGLLPSSRSLVLNPVVHGTDLAELFL
jgi:hypothetical protein